MVFKQFWSLPCWVAPRVFQRGDVVELPNGTLWMYYFGGPRWELDGNKNELQSVQVTGICSSHTPNYIQYINIYIYGYIMIYQYMHIEFYLSFPLIYAGGLDGLPNEGIQMQIGLKCPGTDVGLCWDAAWSSPSHSACVTCDLPRWVEWQKPRQASNQIWRTRGSRPSR